MTTLFCENRMADRQVLMGLGDHLAWVLFRTMNGGAAAKPANHHVFVGFMPMMDYLVVMTIFFPLTSSWCGKTKPSNF